MYQLINTHAEELIETVAPDYDIHQLTGQMERLRHAGTQFLSPAVLESGGGTMKW
jgi:hypothetical protein